tara:strand:+ start:567 stop:1337 length:771 start_codon:yes stop_codon:yes gene_type:complete
LPDLEALPKSVNDDRCLGIQLREEEQCELLEQLSTFYDDLPFSNQPGKATRYYYDNRFFGHSDAIVLTCMMRKYTPGTVIEIGSGFSSAVMLDVNGLFFDNGINLTFVEPYPERLHSLVKPTDRYEIHQRGVQDVSLDVFSGLGDGDILFIDSSHVSKYGSDVNDIFFRILPSLAKGVIVHVHDISWPFEYPEAWVRQGRAWNESYLLRAFLQHNNAFEILYFNAFMAHRHRDLIDRTMPLMLHETGGSIWLRRSA